MEWTSPYMRTTYDRLFEKLGPPTMGPDKKGLEKHTCEWTLDLDGNVCTSDANPRAGYTIWDPHGDQLEGTPRGQYA